MREAWQPISARTPEAALISSHRSCLCADCSSAKECQVRLLWPSIGLLLPPSTPSLPEAHRGRQACGWPPSGIESHTGLIHLASGNRHLSLRMPPGTHRQGLILGWGARRCDALRNAYRHILTHTPCSVCCCVIKDLNP